MVARRLVEYSLFWLFVASFMSSDMVARRLVEYSLFCFFSASLVSSDLQCRKKVRYGMSRSLQNAVIGMGFSLLPTGRLLFHSSRAAIKVASLDQSFRPFCLLLVGRRSVDAIFAVSRVMYWVWVSKKFKIFWDEKFFGVCFWWFVLVFSIWLIWSQQKIRGSLDLLPQNLLVPLLSWPP